MLAGSKITAPNVTDREKSSSKPPKDETGAAGAVWLQGAELIMNEGAEICDMMGRAVYVDGGSATISGDIFNIKADADMWQGTAGLAVHGRGDSDITLTASCEIRDFNTSANQGSAVGIYSSDLDMQNGAKITNIKGTMALYMDDMGKDYQHTALVNGTVEKVENNPVMRSWYGHIEIGSTGIVQDCVSKDGWTDGQVLYTNNGSKYTIRGKILNNKGTVLYIANQSGGRPEVTMEEGAEISGTKGAGLLGGGVAVRVNNGSLFTMNGGTISGNGVGVEVTGKSGFKGVEFVMNGGTISGNSSGLKYTVTGESKVRLNGGTLSDNGTTYQISASGGSAKDGNENIYIASGVLQGNTTVYTSFGTLTLDKTAPSLWLGTASSTAKTHIDTLVKAVEGQANWAVKGNALWFKADSETLHFSMHRHYSVDKGIRPSPAPRSPSSPTGCWAAALMRTMWTSTVTSSASSAMWTRTTGPTTISLRPPMLTSMSSPVARRPGNPDLNTSTPTYKAQKMAAPNIGCRHFSWQITFLHPETVQWSFHCSRS